ncbi:F-box only protein 42-like [Tubulanus polymorphus]|uniref:F-box only protein 42-like n=1 Tax=Tubulanus polymorphus TaxID=672921 RepID=UPI003DA67F62
MELQEIPRKTTSGPYITDRYSHCACYYEKVMYVFGGCTSPNATFNNLWKFDLGTREWHGPLAMGNYPSPKACSSMVTYKDSLLLFGGWSHPTPYPLHQAARFFSELHTYIPAMNEWIHTATYNSPPPTAGHSACIVGDLMVVFGGSHGQNNSCNDIWVLDILERSWTKIKTARQEPQPMPRYGQAQVLLDDSHILIVGGCGGPNMVFNDIWMLEMGNFWKWHQIEVLNTENTPSQLWCRDTVKIGNMLVTLSKGSRSSREKMTIRKIAANVAPRPRQQPQPTPPKELLKFYSSSDTDSSESADEMNFHRRQQQKRTFTRPLAPGTSPGDARASTSQRRENRQPIRTGPPSIRPNAMNNRQKQLEMLKSYEERIQQSLRSKLASTNQTDNKFESTILLHVLDISEVIKNHSCRWLDVSEIPAHTKANSDELLFYSLIEGRGEAVMFGGLRTDPNTMHMGIGQFAVINDLFVLTPIKKF